MTNLVEMFIIIMISEYFDFFTLSSFKLHIELTLELIKLKNNNP